jgi:8-amino-3,8-dideoxy-alpha-D-manno-octulosonate transaminase
LRDIPNGSYETADALVFLVDSNQTARQCRDALIKAGLGTKILPEAITWHFAGTWIHMPELVKRNGEDLINAFPVSLQLLNRSVSLPIAINIVKDFPIKIKEALISVLQS